MENIFGLILFVVYLIFGVLGNRKKGMQKGGRRGRPKAFPDLQEVFKSRETAKTPTAKKTAGTSWVRPFEEKKPTKDESFRRTPMPARVLREEIPPVKPAGSAADVSVNSGAYEASPNITMDAANIKQAIIWSEILQKPLSMRKDRRPRYGGPL